MENLHEFPEPFDDPKYIVYVLYTRYGITQAKIAELLNVSQSTISEYIRDVGDGGMEGAATGRR